MVTWIIHDAILRGSSYQNLDEVIKACGYDVYTIKEWMVGEDLPLDLPKCEPIIPYATIDMMRRLPKSYIGRFMDEQSLKYHVYTSLMDTPTADYLNADAVCTTYRRFKENLPYWFQLFNSSVPVKYNNVFIRPDSGEKTFTGFVANYDSVQYDINHLNHKIDDHSLVWVSSSKRIKDEARFIICGDKVVDGSRYATDSGNTLIEDKNFPIEFYELANKVAQSTWKPDSVFTLDIGMSSFGPKIIEMNSWCCAGWYACNPEKIVREVSEHVQKMWDDYQDDLSVDY